MKLTITLLLIAVAAQTDRQALNVQGLELGYRTVGEDRTFLYRATTDEADERGYPVHVSRGIAVARTLPKLLSRRKLALSYKKNIVQIFAKCYISKQGQPVRCTFLSGAKEPSEVKAATRFLSLFRFNTALGNSAIANHVAIDLSVSSKPLNSADPLCRSPIFCGIPVLLPAPIG